MYAPSAARSHGYPTPVPPKQSGTFRARSESRPLRPGANPTSTPLQRTSLCSIRPALVILWLSLRPKGGLCPYRPHGVRRFPRPFVGCIGGYATGMRDHRVRPDAPTDRTPRPRAHLQRRTDTRLCRITQEKRMNLTFEALRPEYEDLWAIVTEPGGLTRIPETQREAYAIAAPAARARFRTVEKRTGVPWFVT